MKTRFYLKKSTVKRFVICAAIFVFAFLLSFSNVLYNIDSIFSDRLYQHGAVPNPKIKIVAIDERTINAYGDVSSWTRDITAALVDRLIGDGEHAPAVIGFDIMFVTEKDEAADARFAEACARAGNVVSAINVVYRDRLSLHNGRLDVDKEHVEMVEYPYQKLRDSSDYGFANTYLDRDGYIRYAKTEAAYGGEVIRSFPVKIYEKYMEAQGMEAALPKTTSNGFYSFAYTGGSGTYEAVSLCDVLDGRIDPRAFEGAIVLVGAYAPGMQDAYAVPIERGEQMYGVEIHANIINALMDGRTSVPVNELVYALLTAVLAIIFGFLVEKMKILPATLMTFAFVLSDIVVTRLLYDAGLEMRLLEPVLTFLGLYTVRLVVGYIGETVKKRRILGAFRKYVAPEVVKEIAERGGYRLHLGGERRNIAVLFVDIRGFTPMSEGLKPEEVVEILNEYLSLTTDAIFKNKGTLDKFIGDATMAVFNAPFDLDDYVFRAVCAALDIAAGSAELEARLMARFGKSVSFGIGVNCGDAVVGNIGCEHRMDYTAIGDTVNTAARLEGKAGRGQILISEAVYRALEGRIDASEIGVIPLKGKTNDVFVYQLDGVRGVGDG